MTTAPIPLRQMLFSEPDAAVSALEAVGARYEPRLDLVTDVPAFGRIARRFGILRSPFAAGTVADPAVLDPFRAILGQTENQAVAARLREGALDYCPGSKHLLIQLRPLLFARRIHAPWTLRPMNMDFMSLAAKANRAQPFGFRTFYSEQVQLLADQEVRVLQLFSFPLSGSPDQTLLEPDRDDELDLHVGVILETDFLPG